MSSVFHVDSPTGDAVDIQDLDQDGHEQAEKLLEKLVEVTCRHQLEILSVVRQTDVMTVADRFVEDVIDVSAHPTDDDPLIPEVRNGRRGILRHGLGSRRTRDRGHGFRLPRSNRAGGDDGHEPVSASRPLGAHWRRLPDACQLGLVCRRAIADGLVPR